MICFVKTEALVSPFNMTQFGSFCWGPYHFRKTPPPDRWWWQDFSSIPFHKCSKGGARVKTLKWHKWPAFKATGEFSVSWCFMNIFFDCIHIYIYTYIYIVYIYIYMLFGPVDAVFSSYPILSNERLEFHLRVAMFWGWVETCRNLRLFLSRNQPNIDPENSEHSWFWHFELYATSCPRMLLFCRLLKCSTLI